VKKVTNPPPAFVDPLRRGIGQSLVFSKRLKTQAELVSIPCCASASAGLSPLGGGGRRKADGGRKPRSKETRPKYFLYMEAAGRWSGGAVLRLTTWIGCLAASIRDSLKFEGIPNSPKPPNALTLFIG